MNDRERDIVEDGDYEFMTETIKKHPVNKRKLFKKIFLTIFLGLLFGVCACLAFLLCFPRLQVYFNPPSDTKPVSLPVAESTQDEEPIEPFVLPEQDVSAEAQEGGQDTAAPEAGEEAKAETTQTTETDEGTKTGNAGAEEEKTEEKAAEDTKSEDKEDVEVKPEEPESDEKPEEDAEENNTEEEKEGEPEEAQAGEETGEYTKPEEEAGKDEKDTDAAPEDTEEKVIVNNVVETIEKQLELDDYRSLLRKISAIAETTQKSLVTVSGVSSNTDWFNNSYENNNSTTGLIVADNGKELLIVSPADVLHNAKNVRVTFCDGEMYSARVKESDSNVGLCIVAIDLERISETTSEQIEMAQFGSLATSAVGVPVVAVGAPYGTSGSVGMGQITSNSLVIDKTDANVRIISTDIYGSTDASGVFVNYNGRIVGIICHEDMSGNMPNLLRAYSVSDISDSIEKISNGQPLAAVGIIGTDVTEEANSNRGVPFGAYVKEVIADSPAMKAGIRNGDVIVKMGTIDIGSFTDYKQAMLKYQPGELVTVTLQRPGRDEYTEMTYDLTLEVQK
ncbi:MAG: PDZ domain-containing protein [Lachnospiraceae bacterium]|nr:PDZ domain-containing protein [Lachnospiraceae bacterium]